MSEVGCEIIGSGDYRWGLWGVFGEFYLKGIVIV